MPSKSILKQKEKLVDSLSERLNSSVSGVVVDYKGITVAQDTQLRAAMRKAGVEYTVLKNSMLLRAAQKSGLGGLEPALVGTTALATSADPVAAAKTVSDFAAKVDKLKVKLGYVDGKIIDPAGVKALAELPSKEVLVSRVLGGLNAPITGFVNVLNGNLRGLAIALKAIAEQKSA